jgi:homoserine kinase type II
MSVYTLLSLQDIQPFVAAYGLPVATTLTPIKGGIENSNYFLTLADGRELVLTLFEELSATNAAFLAPLLTHLQSAGIAVAAPLPDRHQVRLGRLAGKPAQLAPRLSGSHPDMPSATQCRAMGSALAALHLALQDYPLHRDNAHGPEWWNDVATRWQPRLSVTDRELLTRTLAQYARVCAEHPDLPRGLIHGDLFRDNTLFSGDSVSAILDFSETSRDHWLLDISITVNDFCRQWPSDEPDSQRRDAFLQGYESRRALTAAEKKALPVFLAVAAMRFWLSRLDIGSRNAEEGRGGEHVLEKDPAEMRALCARLLASA